MIIIMHTICIGRRFFETHIIMRLTAVQLRTRIYYNYTYIGVIKYELNKNR